MGRRGPAPAPTAVKLAKGETRPSRVNYESPLPRDREPRMPPGLDADSRIVWRRVLREMAGTGVILAADADVLRVYCDAVASYVRNRELLSGSGYIIRGARGNELVQNPLVRIVREERDAIRLLARDLGLSPSARAGLRIDMAGGPGDIDAILGPSLRPLRVVGGEDDE